MPEQRRLYGGSFNPDARNDPRAIISRWVKEGASVLEVGPGDGVVSRYLKLSKGCYTVGVEVMPEALEVAWDAFHHLIIGNIEDRHILKKVATFGPFDHILFVDVLEHLVDPWSMLQHIRSLLKPFGNVLLSVPNVAHWSMRLNLLLGRFDYADGYLMDRSHLRWFTRRSARAMAEQAGYHIWRKRLSINLTSCGCGPA
ncbi:MAG: class I SAM-dependent methyltransferase [Anaerolineae bacterium]